MSLAFNEEEEGEGVKKEEEGGGKKKIPTKDSVARKRITTKCC